MIDHLRDAALWYGLFAAGVTVGVLVTACLVGARTNHPDD